MNNKSQYIRTSGMTLLLALLTTVNHTVWAQESIENNSTNSVDSPAVKKDEIIVIGRRNDLTINDVAGTIAVVDQKRMEDELVTNMSELFLQEPGISVTGDVGNAQNINVRGMSSDRILMIKDGMRLNEGYGADGLNDIVGRGFLETDNLERVEVAKGPFSSLYGSDALGGIVVFKTKDASTYLDQKDWYGAIRAGFSGRSDEYKVGGTGAIRFGKLDTLVNFTHREGGQYKRSENKASDAGIKSNSVLLKSRYNLSAQDYVDASIEYYKQEFDLPDNGEPHGFWLNLPGYQIVEQSASDEKETTSVRLNYISERLLGLADYLDLAIYSQETSQIDVDFLELDIDSPFTPYVGPREMTDNNLYKQQTYGFTSTLTKELGNQNIGYGLDIETTETLRSNKDFRVQGADVIRNNTTYPFPKNDTLRIGAYFFDEFTSMNDKLKITPGARWDYYKMTPDEGITATTAFEKIKENHLSPNLGIVLEASSHLTWFGQYSEGFKVPPYDLAYIFLDQSIFGYKIIPAETDINPETSRSLETGIRANIGKFTGSFSAYHNDFDDFISVSQVGTEPNPFFNFPTQVFQYSNIENVTIKGIEGKIRFEAENGISTFVNAAFQTGKNNNTREYITTISPFNGTMGASYSGENFGANLVVRWASEMNKINAGTQGAPSWAVLDLTANWHVIDGLRINAGIQNLLDKDYTVYSSVAGLSDGQDLTRFARAGRTASITAEFEF